MKYPEVIIQTMTKKERVLRAMNFENPDRIPIWHFNYNETEGDIIRYELAIETDGLNEWGYRWKTMNDGTMGQPSGPVIPEWYDLEEYRFPEPRINERLKGLKPFQKSSRNHYLLAGMGITGFTTYTFLRGFENAMVDFLQEPEKSEWLLDRIFSFECDLITLAAEKGFDGVHFQDDWGTQDSLIISPESWRRLFRPRYRAQFEHAHQHGLHVWFHCCGNILSILPDFAEIGVDVMNISQPNVVNLSGAGINLKGRQCFMVPISYQTVSISGSREDIFEEAKRLFMELGTEKGGFIGYVEEYSSIGMSRENYQACIDAFRALNGFF